MVIFRFRFIKQFQFGIRTHDRPISIYCCKLTCKNPSRVPGISLYTAVTSVAPVNGLLISLNAVDIDVTDIGRLRSYATVAVVAAVSVVVGV